MLLIQTVPGWGLWPTAHPPDAHQWAPLPGLALEGALSQKRTSPRRAPALHPFPRHCNANPICQFLFSLFIFFKSILLWQNLKHISFPRLTTKEKKSRKEWVYSWHENSTWLALSPLKAAGLFPDGCLVCCMQMRHIWMSPMSVVAAYKCHRS